MAMTGGTAKLVYTGYGNGRSDFPINVYVYYKTSQSIANNQSTVTCGMYVTTPGSAYDIGSWADSNGSYVGTSSLTFNGAIPNFGGTRWLVENKTFTVNHNADGSGKVTIYWKWGVNSSWGRIQNISGSFEVALPSIPRTSHPTASSSTVEFGRPITIYTNRKSTNFTHRLYYKYGSVSWIEITTSASVTDSYQWTVPKTLLNQIPNASSLTMTICCSTYNGSNWIGEDYVYFIATLPATDYDCFPSIDGISWTKTSSEPSGWPLTKGVSKGTMTMTGVKGAYGSTIKSYSLSFAGLSSTSSTLTVNNIASSGSLKAIAIVTDSRSRTFHKEVTFTVSDYTKPTVSVEAYRSDSAGVEDSSGEYLCVKASATVTAIGNNSLQSLVLKYKKRTDSSYTSVTLTAGTAKVVAASSDNTWDWVVTAADRVSSSSDQNSIATGAVVLDILANGRGIGLGKVAEKEGLDSAWDFMRDGVAQVDYVVEQGTSGYWFYRKWLSGRAEAWLTTEVSFTATPSAILGGYYTSAQLDMPSGVFNKPPNCIAQGRTGTGLGFATVSSVSTTMISLGIFGNQNATTSYITSIYAMGRWK